MGRKRKPANQKLNDSINVPVNRSLKRRIAKLASGQPLTRYARSLLEEAVAAKEVTAGHEPVLN